MSFIKSFFQFTEGLIDIPINTRPPLLSKENITVLYDFVYNRETPDICKLDTYFIKRKSGSYPVMMYIHGGGFTAGDKRQRSGLAKWFASMGFFVVNVNYGLCPEYQYPKPVHHVVDAFNWIIDNAEEYHLDVDKIAVAGDSAGAYFAAQLAAITSNPEFAEAQHVSPKGKIGAAVLNCGLYDISEILKQKLIFNLNIQIFETFSGCNDEDFDTYAYKQTCSPINGVTKQYPPTFLLYAKKDLFCAGQSERLLDALENAHVYTEDFFSDDLMNNHCFSFNWVNRKSQAANKLIVSFLTAFMDGSLHQRTLEERLPKTYAELMNESKK